MSGHLKSRAGNSQATNPAAEVNKTAYYCANPLCRKPISHVPKSGNKIGRQQYCSVPCYHLFSPRKIQVVMRWHPDVTDENIYAKFIEVINYVNKVERAKKDRSTVLQISRTAYRSWSKEAKSYCKAKGLSYNP